MVILDTKLHFTICVPNKEIGTKLTPPFVAKDKKQRKPPKKESEREEREKGAGEWSQKGREILSVSVLGSGSRGKGEQLLRGRGTTSTMAGHGDVELPTDRGAARPASECARAQHQRRQLQQQQQKQPTRAQQQQQRAE